MKIQVVKSKVNRLDWHPSWKVRGMTLIELAIVVVIAAVLAAIAYPSYQQYVVRANRSEAQQWMLDIANREEEYFLNTRSYGNMTELAVNVPERIGRYYDVTVAVNNSVSPQTYTITAAPKVGTAQADDGTLTLNEQGMKTPADKWK